MKIEDVIFSNLLYSEEYTRQVLPFLKVEYFHDQVDAKIFSILDNYVVKYNSIPSKDALLIDLSNEKGLSESGFTIAREKISGLTEPDPQDFSWAIDKTETFCKDKAIYNGIMASIKILDDTTGNLNKGSIPQIMSDALGVSFDTSVGHDYIDDAESRYNFYHEAEEKIQFDVEYLNRITNGGLSRKTLTALLASTGVGKSALMCHFAAANITMGKNVLYITLEMSEEKIAERIDANLLDVDIARIRDLSKEEFTGKIDKLKSKSVFGKLIVKEYPTGAASAANFRHLLNELKLKKNFKPDVIYIDYLNICASARVKNNQANSYTIIKSIAEEIRGLMVEFDCVGITATQTNRTGTGNSDIELTDTSESMGTPMSLDLYLALISTEELEALGQIMIKQLKNRYNDVNKLKRFTVGIDRSKMRLYDVEQSAQNNLISDTPSTPERGRFNDKQNNTKKFTDFK